MKKKEVKAYGIDLITALNFEKLMDAEFVEFVSSLDGFIGFGPWGGGAECNFFNSPSNAALFDSASNRNKAYREISKRIECAVIMETAHIPAEYAGKK